MLKRDKTNCLTHVTQIPTSTCRRSFSGGTKWESHEYHLYFD